LANIEFFANDRLVLFIWGVEYEGFFNVLLDYTGLHAFALIDGLIDIFFEVDALPSSIA
jgi:hypothetical protein